MRNTTSGRPPLTNELKENKLSASQTLIICTLGGSMESRARGAGSHVRRVGEIAALLARLNGCQEEHIEKVRFAAFLHDAGKVRTPETILNKPGSLTDEEWMIIKNHTLDGWNILKDTGDPVLDLAAIVALEHHERWDGRGYPHEKKGTDITLEGRIVCLADVMDSLLIDSCYKEAWGFEDVTALFKESRGTHFDPDLTDLLLSHQEDIRKIYRKFPYE